jgi:putative phosphoribosyl transferase
MWSAADGEGATGNDNVRMEFLDRHDAGRRLVAQLLPLAGERPIVIALPRGGVPVGFEIARRLGARLDAFVVRKLMAEKR